MINNNLIFFDFETGSRNKLKTQPLQLAAVCIDVRTLVIKPDSYFESLIRPLDDEQAILQGLDPVEDDALAVNHLDRKDLAKAPELKEVWDNFVAYVSSYATGKKVWDFPGRAGFNNSSFDDWIIHRLCEKYGPYDAKFGDQALFNPKFNIDVHKVCELWFNNLRINPQNSISMDSIRDYMGYTKVGAHNAKVDVEQGADLAIRYLDLTRRLTKRIQFKDCVNKRPLNA